MADDTPIRKSSRLTSTTIKSGSLPSLSHMTPEARYDWLAMTPMARTAMIDELNNQLRVSRQATELIMNCHEAMQAPTGAIVEVQKELQNGELLVATIMENTGQDRWEVMKALATKMKDVRAATSILLDQRIGVVSKVNPMLPQTTIAEHLNYDEILVVLKQRGKWKDIVPLASNIGSNCR